MCSGLECCRDVYPSLDACMWFGDDSSKDAISTLSCGGDVVCYGRAGERLYADARGMDIPRARHRMRGMLILPRREVCGRTGLYNAGLGGWATSVSLGSDCVTSLRISPQTCTGLLTTAFAVPAAVRRAGSIPVCLCHSQQGPL